MPVVKRRPKHPPKHDRYPHRPLGDTAMTAPGSGGRGGGARISSRTVSHTVVGKNGHEKLEADKLRKLHVTVEEAPEPEVITWEHLEYTKSSQRCRRPVLGSWVGVRRRFLLSLCLTASRMV